LPVCENLVKCFVVESVFLQDNPTRAMKASEYAFEIAFETELFKMFTANSNVAWEIVPFKLGESLLSQHVLFGKEKSVMFLTFVASINRGTNTNHLIFYFILIMKTITKTFIAELFLFPLVDIEALFKQALNKHRVP